MAINSEPRDGRGACQQIGFCFQGCKSGAKWSTLYTEIPKGEATGNLEVRPNSMVIKIEHDASGKVTGVVYADQMGAMQRQKARVVAVAGNSIESRGDCSTAPRPCSRTRQLVRQVGATSRHMTGSVRGVREVGAHVSRHHHGGIIRDEAKNDPKRGFVGGYEMETLSISVPFMAAFLNPGAGTLLHVSDGVVSADGRHVAGRRGHAAGINRITARSESQRTSSACRWRACISTITTTSRCATMPTSRGRRLRGRRRHRDLSDAALPEHA
jgi:hypothetical protein